jgi:diguanylate cyclase (GGDEF)-like protein
MAMQHNQAMALQADTVLIRRDGREFMLEDSTSVIHDSQGKITGAVIVFRDITAARAMAAKMEYLAQHDFLTKLPNRVLLNDRIAQAISISERNGVGLAIMFLDLDNFKQINDSLGHGVGDKLLQSVAKRLGNCVRRSDTISRQGGDEFVILLSEYRDVKDAVLTAEKIANVFARAHLIEEHELHVTASIGVSTYPADGLDGETLIKLADTAMYNAKQKGGGSYQFFNEEMNISAPDR